MSLQSQQLDRRWILPLAGCLPYQRCCHSCAGLSGRSVVSLHPRAPMPLPNLHAAQDGYAVLSSDGPGEYDVAFEVRVAAAALPCMAAWGSLAHNQPYASHSCAASSPAHLPLPSTPASRRLRAWRRSSCSQEQSRTLVPAGRCRRAQMPVRRLFCFCFVRGCGMGCCRPAGSGVRSM